MEGIRALQQAVDYGAVRWAVEWTAAAPWHAAVSYVAADLLVFVFPLVLLYLWEQRPHGRGDKYGPKKAAVMGVMSLALALAIKSLIAFLVYRARPFVIHPDIEALILRTATDNSFPSGHTTVAFSVAASIFFSGYRKLGGALLVIAALVGAGRVFAGVHYPTDVAAAILISVAAAWYLHSEASSMRRYLPDK